MIADIAETVGTRHPLVAEPPFGTCWRRAERRRYGSGPEAHRELVVLHALSGRAEYLLDGEVHVLTAGTLLWALVGQAHVLLSDTDAFDMWVMLISDAVLPGGEAGLPPLSVAEQGPVPPRRLNAAANRELATIAEAARDAATPELQRLGLRWWLSRAWAHWQDAEGRQGRPVHPAVGRAASALRANPTLSLGDVACEVGLSPGRLSKLFKSETGQGIAAFRTDQKLGRVEAAMREGERNLLRAAMEAGFGSYPQFYRCFRARYGLCPRAYFLSVDR